MIIIEKIGEIIVSSGRQHPEPGCYALTYKIRPICFLKLFSPLFFNKPPKSFNKPCAEMFVVSKYINYCEF